MFAYMMPLMAGARREFSKPFDDFWCCVGTGMESHSKHGDSIYWKRGDQLYVNLYIPSELTWKEQGATFAMRTDYPYVGEVISRGHPPRGSRDTFAVAFACKLVRQRQRQRRSPPRAAFMPNARRIPDCRRQWISRRQSGTALDMPLRAEPTRDDPNLLALLRARW